MHDKKSDVSADIMSNQESSKLECKCSERIGRTNSVAQDSVWSPLLVVVATCWIVPLNVLAIAMVRLAYTVQLPRLVPMSGIDLRNAYDLDMSVESD
jgi:hypothetical protein